ncbi:MAG: magnesium transporter [Desulfovibrionales bacterium]|jgi:magnesium transporter|nr:magnesium transporter [Desulfovibrionales bacterium]
MDDQTHPPDEELREAPPAELPENPHPADTAEHIEGLDLNEQIKFIKQLPVRDAAQSMAEMDLHDQQDILTRLNLGLAARIVAEMAPDDAADVLDGIEEDRRRTLLRSLQADDREEITHLLAYDPDTAGGVMNTDVVILHKNLTVDQAIPQMRKEVHDEDKEIPYYAYLVDDAGRLDGVLSMRDLLIAKPGTKRLSEMISDQNLISVRVDEDREEVAHLIARYNFLALPVVDDDTKFLGVVTVDDVIDIIHEEASEDMQAMVGAGADETTDSPWSYSVKKRLPWLITNVATSAVSAVVVHMFEGSVSQMAILAVLMPVVANQAGNTGQQALAVMIRQLATERFDRKKSWLAVIRELRIGLVNGAFISCLVMLAVFMLTSNIALAGVMGLALYFDMLMGSLAGSSIPLILKELGRDPAQASSIFLTTITDSLGFFSLLGLAGLVLLH